LLGNDLVLRIGLPLVAGLSLREFAGVMAHEFGHFTQGFGMRFSYVIARINFWFIRVIYQRDAWDLWLDEWTEEAEDWRVMLVVNCARLGVWFSRLLLKLLMYFGHGVCCFLLRQMEYHADACEIRLVGSAAFESTARRLAALNDAAGRAYKEMRTSWTLNRRLPEDFPRFLVWHESKTAPIQRQRLQDTLGLARTGLFHTHPSDGDRIRAARRANEPGIFHLEQPASILFSHFDVVAKQVTHLHYSEDHGLLFDSTNLRPVEPV
jgi:Zn-dependent protease with chaperone function